MTYVIYAMDGPIRSIKPPMDSRVVCRYGLESGMRGSRRSGAMVSGRFMSGFRDVSCANAIMGSCMIYVYDD